MREDVVVGAADLLSTRGLAASFGEADLRLNMNIALAYMESWLRCALWCGGVTRACVRLRRCSAGGYGHGSDEQARGSTTWWRAPPPSHLARTTHAPQTNSGVGCVPIHNLMEDAATAEISRSQLWQWVRHRAATREGRPVTAEWALALLDEETQKFRA